MTKKKRSLVLLICSLFGAFLAFRSGQNYSSNLFEVKLGFPPVQAQFLQPEIVAPKVYEELPDFPLANDYIKQGTEEVDTNNTLVSRLLRYHLYVKRRPPSYRLDWKLTLADYLGAHENLIESQYPGYSTLRENPMERDRAIINSLTRQQRNELVDVLVSIFNPEAAQAPTPTPTVTPSPTPSPNPRNRPNLPQPGAADLLRF